MSMLVLLTISPESVDTDIGDLEKRVRLEVEKKGSLIKIEREPVAFGLFSLKVTALLEENPDLLNKLEDSLSNIGGVKSVQVKSVSRSF